MLSDIVIVQFEQILTHCFTRRAKWRWAASFQFLNVNLANAVDTAATGFEALVVHFLNVKLVVGVLSGVPCTLLSHSGVLYLFSLSKIKVFLWIYSRRLNLSHYLRLIIYVWIQLTTFELQLWNKRRSRSIYRRRRRGGLRERGWFWIRQFNDNIGHMLCAVSNRIRYTLNTITKNNVIRNLCSYMPIIVYYCYSIFI